MDQPIQPVQMQPIQPNKTNILAGAIIIFLVSVSIGFVMGYYLPGVISGKIKTEDSRQAMLKEIFGNAILANNLFGEILNVSSDKKSLTAKVSGVYGINLPKDFQEKKVLISENTKIVLRTNKAIADFDKELAELRKKGDMNPPLPYTEKEIAVGELKVGDKINFDFAPGENINILNAQFNAVQINVNR